MSNLKTTTTNHHRAVSGGGEKATTAKRRRKGDDASSSSSSAAVIAPAPPASASSSAAAVAVVDDIPDFIKNLAAIVVDSETTNHHQTATTTISPPQQPSSVPPPSTTATASSSTTAVVAAGTVVASKPPRKSIISHASAMLLARHGLSPRPANTAECYRAPPLDSRQCLPGDVCNNVVSLDVDVQTSAVVIPRVGSISLSAPVRYTDTIDRASSSPLRASSPMRPSKTPPPPPPPPPPPQSSSVALNDHSDTTTTVVSSVVQPSSSDSPQPPPPAPKPNATKAAAASEAKTKQTAASPPTSSSATATFADDPRTKLAEVGIKAFGVVCVQHHDDAFVLASSPLNELFCIFYPKNVVEASGPNFFAGLRRRAVAKSLVIRSGEHAESVGLYNVLRAAEAACTAADVGAGRNAIGVLAVTGPLAAPDARFLAIMYRDSPSARGRGERHIFYLQSDLDAPPDGSETHATGVFPIVHCSLLPERTREITWSVRARERALGTAFVNNEFEAINRMLDTSLATIERRGRLLFRLAISLISARDDAAVAAVAKLREAARANREDTSDALGTTESGMRLARRVEEIAATAAEQVVSSLSVAIESIESALASLYVEGRVFGASCATARAWGYPASFDTHVPKRTTPSALSSAASVPTVYGEYAAMLNGAIARAAEIKSPDGDE